MSPMHNLDCEYFFLSMSSITVKKATNCLFLSYDKYGKTQTFVEKALSNLAIVHEFAKILYPIIINKLKCNEAPAKLNSPSQVHE